MGYDKPDLTFVIHYQTPGNVVAYYQQVGRAGRAISRAFGILLSGNEEDRINEYFREAAFPPEIQVKTILKVLEEAEEGMSLRDLERAVNLRRSQIEKVLKLLVVESHSPIIRIESKWYRTPNPYIIDQERIDHLTKQREVEWQQMRSYLSNEQCLMLFLAQALDDSSTERCGRCAVCLRQPVVSVEIKPESLTAAQGFTRRSEMPLDLKKQWDLDALPLYRAAFKWTGMSIPPTLRGEDGWVLSQWGEPVWGDLVARGKAQGHFDDALVHAAVDLIRNRWPDVTKARWVTCIPSHRQPELVADFSARLARALGLKFRPVIVKTCETEPQKTMENRFHQCCNLDGVFEVTVQAASYAPVILIDDAVDSAWTLTLAAVLLRQVGVRAVYPFALATTAKK